MAPAQTTFTAFLGGRRIAAGDLAAAARAAKAEEEAGQGPVLIFDDLTGRQVELDLRGSLEDVLARLPSLEPDASKPVGRGRPRLGVTAREVTLLPIKFAAQSQEQNKNICPLDAALPQHI